VALVALEIKKMSNILDLTCKPPTEAELVEYAISLARPSCCETTLARFLTLVRMYAKNKKEVYNLFLELRNDKKEKERRTAKTIELHRH
jgi:hypothetical protein